MIDLAIAKAPHQVLYSIERLRESKLKNVLVLDMFNLANVNNTITGVLKFKEWDTVIKLNYTANDARGILKYIFYLVIIRILSFFKIKINNLIIGDGNIIFAKLILDNFKYIKNTVVIGDGTDLIINNESRKGIRYHCRIGMKARKILRLLNLKFNDEYNYDELFTYLQVDDPRLKLNDFSFLKGLIKSKDNFVDHDSVYFLGTILLDRFNEKEVESIYKQVFTRYPTLEIKYVPHRRATLEQIEIVRSIGRVTIVKTEGEIVETYFMSNNIIPVTLGAFFSNAVFSLAAIYPKLNIDVYDCRRTGKQYERLMDQRLNEYYTNEIKDERIKYKVLYI
jgi:hypothetical protein